MEAIINYVKNRGDGLVPFVLDSGWTGVELVPTPMEINNARELKDKSLNTNGFVIDRIISGVTDYTDWEQLTSKFAPAVTDKILELTGAKWGVWFAMNTRFSNNDARHNSTPVAAPARAAHADLRPEFDPAKIGDEPVSEIAAKIMQEKMGGKTPKKWRVFNIWQQISPPPQDTPLAFCDVRSVKKEDILNGQGKHLDRPDFTFGLTFYAHNPDHKWYYFPDMLPGEAIIFSSLDLNGGEVLRQVPHNAFDLPELAPNFVPRNSVEVRVVAVFEE